MSRQDQWLITATYDGKPMGKWDKKDGGAVTAQDTKYRPGGMSPEVSLGGPVSVENVTLTRMYDPVADKALVKTLAGLVGRARVAVTQTDLDQYGAPLGNPYTYSGTLIRITPPAADSMSNAAAMLEAEISTDGRIA